MNKKYQLATRHNKENLYRIRALIDITEWGIKKGDLGGYIESEENLSHYGSCWVFDDAEVSGKALVRERARVAGNARVGNCAKVEGSALIQDRSSVLDYAIVTEDARVLGDAIVGGRGYITGNSAVAFRSRVTGDAHITDTAQVGGFSIVKDGATIKDNAWLNDSVLIGGHAVIGGNTNIGGGTRILNENIITSNLDYMSIDGTDLLITITKKNLYLIGQAFKLPVTIKQIQDSLDPIGLGRKENIDLVMHLQDYMIGPRSWLQKLGMKK